MSETTWSNSETLNSDTISPVAEDEQKTRGFSFVLAAGKYLDGGVDVVAMDTNGDSHQHVLRPLGDLSVNTKQV